VFGIAKLIEAKGLTKTAAADLMGIARPHLSKVLRGN
jgi:predicted XRE-type DNA-binding protein